MEHWSLMWTCEKLHVKIFRSWLRVSSGETMAGRFYHRSFSENVLKVGSVFVWFVFNWFWSRESLVLRCGISRKKYQLKGVVNQHSKHLSFNPLTQKQTNTTIYEAVANERSSFECKESEWKQPFYCCFFTIDKRILAFNLFSFI